MPRAASCRSQASGGHSPTEGNRRPVLRRLGAMPSLTSRLFSAGVLSLLLGACGSTVSSPSPTATSSPAPATSASTGIPSPPATPAPQGAAPAAPAACLSIGEADCRRAAEAALGALNPAVAPIYLQVGPFGCATGERCPTTLAARPEGDVLVELAGAPAVTIHVIRAQDGSIRGVPTETFGIVVPPSSGPLGRPGPIPFSLGHCGLYSGIDVDGAWWDPVGPIDAEHGDAVNAAEGTLAFVDPAHATFVSRGGLIVSLARRDGPKHLPFCD